MRQGQVFSLKSVFPSTASWELAISTCFSDKTHQLMREQQENRMLDEQLSKIKESLYVPRP